MPQASNPRRSNGHRRDALRRRVLGRGDPCWICGLPIDPSEPNLSPVQGVVDEVVPVSRGGSPYDPGNCRAAHRCCNAWRSSKPEAFVRLVQQRVSLMGGAGTPPAWCALAKRASSDIKHGLRAQEHPHVSTDW
nr:MAG TPA: NinG protein [Caudoviricetes sp.]